MGLKPAAGRAKETSARARLAARGLCGPGGAGPRLAARCPEDLTAGRHTLPYGPGRGWRRGLRAVLVEREAAESRVDSAWRAVRGLGLHWGLDPGSRSTEPATATSAAGPARAGSACRATRPAPAPPPAGTIPPPPRLGELRRLTGRGLCYPLPLATSPFCTSEPRPLTNPRLLWAEPPCW